MTGNSQEFFNLKKELIKDFFSHNIIKVNINEYFTLSSGLVLPIYLDHRLVFSFPNLRKKVIQAWSTLIEHELSISLFKNENYVFSGTSTAGIAPAYALSNHSETGFIYVRDKSKLYGLRSQLEGYCNEASQFIVVDDMVVTGKSVLKNAQVLTEIFGKKNILCATSISCHESQKMRKKFFEHDIKYFSLFTTLEMFQIAFEQNIVDQKSYETITNFLKEFDHS